MKREIVIYAFKPESTNPLIEYVAMENVAAIVNSSVDTLFCDCFEYLKEEDVPAVLSELCKKIRPQGYLTIKILDVKKICLDYIQNKLSNKQYISLVNNKSCVTTLDSISVGIDHSQFKTTKISTDNYTISFTLQKKA